MFFSYVSCVNNGVVLAVMFFFSFLYWLKSPFKVAPMNSKRKSHFPSWIPTKHTKIHTDNLCQCQHTYVRSFLNFFNDFFWGTKNHIRPVLEYIAQISQIPLVLCYEGRTSRTLLRRYILHLRLPQGREFVHYLNFFRIPQAMILYHFVKSLLKLPLFELLSWYYK